MEAAGWASTKDLDHYRHVVATGAYDASIRKRGLQGPKGIKLLLAHDSTKPVGKITKLETRNGNLWMEATVNEEISYGRDIALASRDAGGLSFSVGFYPLDADVLLDANKEPYLYITKVDLTEVSVVVFPGNENAVMVVENKAEPDSFDAVLAKIAKVQTTLAELKCGAQRKQEPIPSSLTDIIQRMKEVLK